MRRKWAKGNGEETVNGNEEKVCEAKVGEEK